MNNNNKKSIYIVQIDGKDVVDGDYKIKSFKRYKVAFDYSLDLIDLKKVYKKYIDDECIFKNKNNKNDKKLYSNLLVSVTFKYKTDKLNTTQIREKLYKDGFTIDGKRYVRYKRSSGSSRVGKCLFIREELYPVMEKYSLMDLQIQDGDEIDLASLEAYISLTTSAIIDTCKINPTQILVIDDYESSFKENAIVTSIKDGFFHTEKCDTEITNSIFDGQSLLDVSVFDKNGYSDKGMLLLRNKFFKSCCFNTNIQQFFKDNNITKISQLNGFTLARDIENIKLITTQSSIKYLKFGTLQDWLKKISHIFGIVKYDKPTHFFEGNLVQTHYQLLNTLEMSELEVEQFLDEEVQYIKKLKDDPSFMRYRLKITNDNAKKSLENLKLDESPNFVYSMLCMNDNITNTQMYKRFLRSFVDATKKRLKAGHILVKGNYSTLFGNPIEMLLHSIGEFNGDSVLGKDEVISYNFDDNEVLAGIRSPHITMGNLWLVKNTRNNFVEKYFNLSKQIVVINSINNNVLERLNGCDSLVALCRNV